MLAGHPMARITALATFFTLAITAAAQPTGCSYRDHLERLVRLRPFSGSTIQFSSYDRRSTTPSAPHWFANSDGFGGEPIPGFVATLRAPDMAGRGLWLVAAVEGPGAIVRTWSAGMGGVLCVELDGNEALLYSGPAAGFLREKSRAFLRQAGIDLDPSGSFVQEDADYLPIPFQRSLKITWEGRLDELHFYHVVVAKGSPSGDGAAPAFTPRDLAQHRETLLRVHAILRGDDDAAIALGPRGTPGDDAEFTAALQPGGRFAWSDPGRRMGEDLVRAGCIDRLSLQCVADDPVAALRGVVLRVRFDGASVPQIEAPLGDFFASAPGVQPHRSLLFTVAADGWMTCRLPMPFDSACEIELQNTTSQPVSIRGRVDHRGFTSAQYIGHLHAKWRAQHDLVASRAGVDVPYVMVQGRGVLVGVACLLMNPSGIPTPGGSWWGEGDEKIQVDGEAFPSTFGTGSEDFFNYAWSRPDLFAHAYCGQPTCTGPGTSGYVTNYRWLVSDCIAFRKSLAFSMELLHHRTTPGFSYASIAYWYATANAIDDHRALTERDLFVPALPSLGVVADGGAKDAVIRPVAELTPRSATALETWSEPLAPNHALVGFVAKGGEQIALTLAVAEPGRYGLHLVALHRADCANLRARVDGAAAATFTLTRASASVQDIALPSLELPAGEHTLVIEAVTPGVVGLDTLWWKRLGPIAFRAEGVLEAEGLRIVAHSEGTVTEIQDLDLARWSAGQHLWVRATDEGEFVEFEVPVPAPGRWAIDVQLTRSYDYGIVQVTIDGKPAGAPVDTFNHDAHAVALLPVVTLPARDLGASMRLRLQVVGTAPTSEAPGHYFGVDWVRLRRAQ